MPTEGSRKAQKFHFSGFRTSRPQFRVVAALFLSVAGYL
jgi:hypothetical protein